MRKMRLRTVYPLLILLALLGSVVTFYATNLLLSDLSNVFYGWHDMFFITTLPAFLFVPDFVVATLFVLHYYSQPQYSKAVTMHSTLRVCIYSVLGILATLISAIFFYHSFTQPYPFPGYILISLALHFLLLIFSMIVRRRVMLYWPDDIEIRSPSFGSRVYQVILCLCIFFAFDRFGAFLLSGIYIHWRTFYFTFPFYVSLLIPMCLLAHIGCYFLGYFRVHPHRRLRNIIIILALNFFVTIATLVISAHNTQFISAISPALALERLATMPLDTILYILFSFGFGFYFLGLAIQTCRDGKKRNYSLGVQNEPIS